MGDRYNRVKFKQRTLKTDDVASSGTSSLVIYKALALALIHVSLLMAL